MDNNGTHLTELSELKTRKLIEQFQTHSKFSVNVRLKHTKRVLKRKKDRKRQQNQSTDDSLDQAPHWSLWEGSGVLWGDRNDICTKTD